MVITLFLSTLIVASLWMSRTQAGHTNLAKERINPSDWWRHLNGTDNVRAMRALERRPQTYGLLLDHHPSLLERYPDVKLVTEPDEIDRAYEAVRY